MAKNESSEAAARRGAGSGSETIVIEKTDRRCPLCEDYAAKQTSKPVAVMSCEGACLRGEVARQAANILTNILISDSLLPT